MIRPCRHCEMPFAPQRSAKYCSDACLIAARERTCRFCGKQFHVHQDTQVGHYCSNECLLKAVRTRGLHEAERARRERHPGRILVPCLWSDCPRPHDLVSIQRSRASDARHPECKVAYRQSPAYRDARWPRQGADVVCEGCGTDLGYRPPAMMDRLLCRDCARQRDKMVRRSRSEEKRGEEHVCGLLACSNRFHAKPARVARSKTGKVYCCHAHARADCSTRTTVRCIACGNTRFYKAAHIPLSVDRDTMSWTCPGCRQPKSAMRVFACLQCAKSYRRRVYFGPRETKQHFCSFGCRRLYYRDLRRRANPCRQCGNIIERRGHGNVYCGWDCYTAHKTGRPNKHYRPSKAEIRVLDAWAAGARGPVRVLAKVTRTSPATVQKLIKAGKLVA